MTMAIDAYDSFAFPAQGPAYGGKAVEPSFKVKGSFFSRAIAWFKAEGETELVKIIRKIAAIAIAAFLAVSLIGIPVLIEGALLWRKRDAIDTVHVEGPSGSGHTTFEGAEPPSESQEGIAPHSEESPESTWAKTEQNLSDALSQPVQSEEADKEPNNKLSEEFYEEESLSALKPSPAGTWTIHGFVPGVLGFENAESHSNDAHDKPAQEITPKGKLFALKTSPAGFWKDGKFNPGESLSKANAIDSTKSMDASQ